MRDNDSSEAKDVLFVVGGAALIVLGAGLIMAHPDIRRYLKTGLGSVLPDLQGNMGTGLAALLPDVERYMKIRSM
jgi:hypothetical protein